jgi:hypothetical protein
MMSSGIYVLELTATDLLAAGTPRRRASQYTVFEVRP